MLSFRVYRSGQCFVHLNYCYTYNNKHSCCKSWKEPRFNDQKVSNVAVIKLIVDTLTCIKIKNRTMCGFVHIINLLHNHLQQLVL